jgi:cytochrome b involved in lipid metabolism
MYSLQEINKHTTIDSCWVIANHKVYDVTDFLKIHPEHVSVIVPKAGQDVTQDYLFHTKHMKKIWQKYCIGYVQPSFCVVS